MAGLGGLHPADSGAVVACQDLHTLDRLSQTAGAIGAADPLEGIDARAELRAGDDAGHGGDHALPEDAAAHRPSGVADGPQDKAGQAL